MATIRRSRPSSKGSDESMVENDKPKSDVPVVEEGKEYKLTIVDMGKQGDGIARLQGLVIFVPGAKPGEEVDVRIKKIGRNCAFAEKIVKEATE
jgi:predicted RNA-binding protein with TRAM domain